VTPHVVFDRSYRNVKVLPFFSSTLMLIAWIRIHFSEDVGSGPDLAK
jgi:hypothetical protein